MALLSDFIPNPLWELEVRAEVRPEITHIAEAGAEDARAHCAVETGELRDSIVVNEEGDGARIEVGTDHWLFVEFGTSFMAAQPFMRPLIDDLGLHR